MSPASGTPEGAGTAASGDGLEPGRRQELAAIAAGQVEAGHRQRQGAAGGGRGETGQHRGERSVTRGERRQRAQVRGGRRGGRPTRDGVHRGERRHAAQRLTGERPPERHRAEQLPVDVDRRAAHPGDDAGAGEALVGEPDEHRALVGTGRVEDAEHLDGDLDPLPAGPLGDAHAFLAGRDGRRVEPGQGGGEQQGCGERDRHGRLPQAVGRCCAVRCRPTRGRITGSCCMSCGELLRDHRLGAVGERAGRGRGAPRSSARRRPRRGGRARHRQHLVALAGAVEGSTMIGRWDSRCTATTRRDPACCGCARRRCGCRARRARPRSCPRRGRTRRPSAAPRWWPPCRASGARACRALPQARSSE